MGRKLKKGQLGTQFNWIFILIAGAVILTFFFSVIQKQRGISAQKISITLINDFETITVGALQAKDTVQTIELPKIDFTLGCTEECTCQFNIGDVSRDYKDKVIFSPSHLTGNEIAIWTLDWNLPFRVTNFLFLSTRNVFTYLIYEEGNPQSERLLDLLERRLPDEILYETIKTTEVPSMTNENYVKAKFVLLAVDESIVQKIDLNEFEDADPSALVVNTDRSLVFYERENPRSTTFSDLRESYHSGEEDLFAAIFSDDADNYECNMKLAFTKAEYVSSIYEARMDRLGEDPGLQAQGCAYQTGDGSDVNVIHSQSRILRNNLGPLSTVAGAASRLSESNEVLLRKSCPTIY